MTPQHENCLYNFFADVLYLISLTIFSNDRYYVIHLFDGIILCTMYVKKFEHIVFMSINQV